MQETHSISLRNAVGPRRLKMILGRIVLIIFLCALCVAIILSILNLTTKWSVAITLAIGTLVAVIICGNAKLVFLVIMAFSIPLNAHFYIIKKLDATAVGGVNFSSVDACLVILFFIWGLNNFKINNKRKESFSGISVPFIFLISIYFLSVLRFVDLLSVFHVIAVIKCFILYLYIAKNVESRKEILFVIGALASATIFEVVIITIQRITGAEVGLHILGEGLMGGSTQRGMGTFDNANTMALIFLDFMLPILLVLYLNKKHLGWVYRRFILFAFLSGLLCLILTRSRGGWVGFCISIIVIFWFAKRAHNVKLQIFGKPLLFILLAVFILIFRFSHILGPRLLEPTEEEVKTAEVRIPLMKVAYNIIKANPVFGVGVGRYWRNMASYDDTEEKVTSRFNDRVHNIYLFIASELGLLGLLVFLWIAFSIYRIGSPLVKSNDPLAATIAVGILGGFSSFFVHGMVDSPIALSKVIILWFLAGFLVALGRLDIGSGPSNKY